MVQRHRQEAHIGLPNPENPCIIQRDENIVPMGSRDQFRFSGRSGTKQNEQNIIRTGMKLVSRVLRAHQGVRGGDPLIPDIQNRQPQLSSGLPRGRHAAPIGGDGFDP